MTWHRRRPVWRRQPRSQTVHTGRDSRTEPVATSDLGRDDLKLRFTQKRTKKKQKSFFTQRLQPLSPSTTFGHVTPTMPMEEANRRRCPHEDDLAGKAARTSNPRIRRITESSHRHDDIKLADDR